MSYVVAVRAMCEFTAREGDLDLRFTPAPSALEGMAGHATVASRRGAGYEKEIALAGEHRGLTVRGRADGYDPVLNRLEEIKTHRGDLGKMPANQRALHWAQARVYGHLLRESRGLAELTVALVYFDVGTLRETVLTETHTAATLEACFVEQCERFVDWAAREDAHRTARNAALRALAFPHAQFRSGQRELAVAAYRAARDGRALLAQAPTGIGKTLGTLFPLLKACAEDHLDRLFFLTAKTPGRALALDAADALRAAAGGALPLRVLELVARDNACEHPDAACHGESCPLARGFYDRLAAARAAALEHGRLDRATVRAAALAHDVCPYYLAQELARWCDVVVGDYNYYYDGRALLHGLAQQNQWRVGVLVDEAHNLLDRARGMYSAALDQRELAGVRKLAPAPLAKALERLNREWNALNREQETAYTVHADVPPRVLSAAQNLIGRFSELAAEAPLVLDAAVLRFCFDAIHFVALAEQFDTHSIFDATLVRAIAPRRGKQASVLCVRNVIPADFLAPRHDAARATVMFSGTLSPFDFYRDTLGLPDDTGALDVEGPFRAEQLTVKVAAHVSTRWRDRERSLEPIVELIAAQYAARPGNYLGFLSSFEYLQQVVARLRERHPELPVWEQAPGMDEAARDAFLARFEPNGRGIGFAVLGGAFSEGVDLAGDRLIGAFVATLGLPQVNDVNEEMRRAMDARFGRGYDYVYLFPGLRKVVQAAGRVIRTEHDEGVVHLIDDRFRRGEVRRLLPRWWRLS
ncbi:ATP-dependent DNA helicase [Burkholderia sp. ABCPW 14]|uniref:helicase C-terminal domain-containing protein n=1 Tax=Burkholderia sp. ABCPW 14 TaxID=1637860 RepID=UPI000770E030|nr:helicase C-terminal domain-containing protein [Burkholderia sp. ABCPW 14]KVD77322.1 ATP-dependent DNA helicase [Burkholderia sp. ABCPW 14]